MPGRPTTRTPEAEKAILDAIRLGQLHRPTVCKLVGISPRTLRRWQRQDEDFDAQLRAAEAKGEARLATLALRGAENDPRLALDLLRARYPERWGRRNAQIEAKVKIEAERPPGLPGALRRVWDAAVKSGWKDRKACRELELWWATGTTERAEQIATLRRLADELEAAMTVGELGPDEDEDEDEEAAADGSAV
ncbi:hypothetical protein [Polyangium aurulentum]|uniref:hypothetical protein n=1 Tax=Polyangium aurulentum TaxID=2567896 RepID=UPI0010AE7AFC|nr:hypothetical protein [Polyangium aurulentum]UQA57079.1 hypothetical protein E8A73_038180 [Polyangium aurulentum]